MKAELQFIRAERRAVYRQAKKILETSLRVRWLGSRSSLRRVIQVWLKSKNRAYLLRLVRQHAFAVAVAGTLLIGVSAQASSPIELSAVAGGTGGFVINGIDAGDESGYSVSGAGDVNGDGLADLVVGAARAEPGGKLQAGESYVVFGKASGTAVELATIASGTGGFVINGIDVSDWSGYSVSGAGDVNADGLADLIVGASSADPGGERGAGESYVVFGNANGTVVELSTIASGTGGFVMNGIDAGDHSGISVSGAGDVNGDGLADLIVGAYEADPGGESGAGESYVVFSPEPAQGRKLWVDFAHGGTEEGTHPLPYDTLQEAVTGVFSGGTIIIKGDTADSDSPETLTINQDVTIEAVSGTVTIGDSAARGAIAGGGFVSGTRE